ncbi:hypothetical protein CDAR_527321 [Caerostris darwini]|uniref:Uncharacterized protein n=1 Tax=Caerostris darwini TaxID=1538125 RepID=A0AAV4WKS4_9ARAC|nr:hypothetical protein CDAR_527321 [Caerostris darwini]
MEEQTQESSHQRLPDLPPLTPLFETDSRRYSFQVLFSPFFLPGAVLEQSIDCRSQYSTLHPNYSPHTSFGLERVGSIRRENNRIDRNRNKGNPFRQKLVPFEVAPLESQQLYSMRNQMHQRERESYVIFPVFQDVL